VTALIPSCQPHAPAACYDWIQTHRLLLVALDNAELPRVDGVLHDKPRQRFLVLGVDLASLDELGLELGDALLVRLGVEVYDDCVDHFRRCD
jgi:hypothetical protein